MMSMSMLSLQITTKYTNKDSNGSKSKIVIHSSSAAYILRSLRLLAIDLQCFPIHNITTRTTSDVMKRRHFLDAFLALAVPPVLDNERPFASIDRTKSDHPFLKF